jgi:cell division inhibitor SulA
MQYEIRKIAFQALQSRTREITLILLSQVLSHVWVQRELLPLKIITELSTKSTTCVSGMWERRKGRGEEEMLCRALTGEADVNYTFL